MNPNHDKRGEFTTGKGAASAAAKALDAKKAPWGRDASTMSRMEALQESKGINDHMMKSGLPKEERAALKDRLRHLEYHHPGVMQEGFDHALGREPAQVAAQAVAKKQNAQKNPFMPGSAEHASMQKKLAAKKAINKNIRATTGFGFKSIR